MATEVHEIVPGHKLRCAEPLLDPGGGRLNVSRAIKSLGGDSLALVAIGGLTGDRLAGLIRAEGVTFLSILGPGETRQSLTVNEAVTGKQFRCHVPAPSGAMPAVARIYLAARHRASRAGFPSSRAASHLVCRSISRPSLRPRCRKAGSCWIRPVQR